MTNPSPPGTDLQLELAYGPHARHRLDVYAPAQAQAAPVLVFFHGGGFIRGDKTARANIGAWGAAQGFVTVLANYRLAPEHRRPSGPEDVAAVWHNVRERAEDWGGDPAKIVLVGESAGAAHVAAAALMSRFQPEGWQIAGAALLSGPYNAGLEAQAPQALGIEQPDVRNNAYFGENRAAWAQASIVDQVDVAPFALLIAAAERDLLQMKVQAGELFARLVRTHGFMPELHWWAGHDHFTPGASLGSPDNTVSGPLAAFVRRITGA
jgi:acetyl esterase